MVKWTNAEHERQQPIIKEKRPNVKSANPVKSIGKNIFSRFPYYGSVKGLLQNRRFWHISIPMQSSDTGYHAEESCRIRLKARQGLDIALQAD